MAERIQPTPTGEGSGRGVEGDYPAKASDEELIVRLEEVAAEKECAAGDTAKQVVAWEHARDALAIREVCRRLVDRASVPTPPASRGTEGNGCLCGKCGLRYRVDVQVPHALWPKIAGATELLCPRCIADGLEAQGEFAAFRLVDVDSVPASRGTGVPTSDRLAEIEATLDRLSPWPWTPDTTVPHDMVVWQRNDSGDEKADKLVMNIGEPVVRVGDICGLEADCRFIAAAPSLVRELLDHVHTLSAAAEQGERDRELLDALDANPRMVGYATGHLGAKSGWTYTTPQYEVLPAENLRDAIQKGLAARPPHQGRA